MKAWHFVGDTLRDGSPIPKDGVWLKHKGKAVICESGLHWSRDPFDALRYAAVPNLCLVEVRGIVQEQVDKGVSLERKIIARMDATEMLGYFSRMQALSVIHFWKAPDVVCDYLMTGDEGTRDAATRAAKAAVSAANAASAARAAWAAVSAANAARAARAAWAAVSAAVSAANAARAARAAWAAVSAANAARAAWAAAIHATAAADAVDAAWAADTVRAARKDFNSLVYECFGDYL